MTKAFIDLVDDIKASELTQKGWDIVGTTLLVLAGIYWLGLCDHGAFFQLTGCVAYIAAAATCVKKTSWGRKFMDSLKGDDEE